MKYEPTMVPGPSYLQRSSDHEAFPNLVSGLFSFGALLLPPLGLVALLLALRGVKAQRRRAWLAVALAVIATVLGVIAWLTLLPQSEPGFPLVGVSV